jgi:hypothetical protein
VRKTLALHQVNRPRQGAFFVLLLAGPPSISTMRRWEQQVLSGARWLVLVALGSGVIWLIVSTALFESRPDAALEAGANRPPTDPHV